MVFMRFYVSLWGAAVVSSLDLSCMFLGRNFEDDAWNERWMSQPRSLLHCTVNCVRDERCRGINFRTSECNITDQTSPASGQWGRVRYYGFRCKLGTATITATSTSSQMSRTSSHRRLTPTPTIGSHAQATTMLVSDKFISRSLPTMIPTSHLSTIVKHRNLRISEESAPTITEKSRPFVQDQIAPISKSASTTPTYTVDATTESPCAFYNITVKTGTDTGAGTNSVVLLYLLGDQGRLTHELDNDDGDDFESGSEDIFQFGDDCIGELLNLTVKVTARGISLAWQLARIRVEISPISDGGPANTTLYTADVNSWLSSDWHKITGKPDERILPFLKLQRST